MRTLNDLVTAGKILHAAVSDAPVWAVAECNTMAKERHWAPFDCLQYKHSLLDRTIERDVLHYARHRNTTVVTWDVYVSVAVMGRICACQCVTCLCVHAFARLGGGRLTGKYRRPAAEDDDSKSEEVDSMRAKSWGITVTDKQYDIIEEVVAIAEELDTTPARVSLAWSLRQSNVLPLVGARTLKQLKDNLGAMELPLSQEHMDRLNTVTNIELGFVQEFIGSTYEENPWATTVKVFAKAK